MPRKSVERYLRGEPVVRFEKTRRTGATRSKANRSKSKLDGFGEDSLEGRRTGPSVFAALARCLPAAAVGSSCEYNSRYLGERAFPPTCVRRGGTRHRRGTRYSREPRFPRKRETETERADERSCARSLARSCTRTCAHALAMGPIPDRDANYNYDRESTPPENRWISFVPNELEAIRFRGLLSLEMLLGRVIDADRINS